MQDAVINFGRIAYAAQAMFGKPVPRAGNQSIIAGTSPSEVYPCKGGGPNDYCYVYTTRAGNHQWQSLLTRNRPRGSQGRPAFRDAAAARQELAAIDAIVSQWAPIRQSSSDDDARRRGRARERRLRTVELSSDPDLRRRGTFVSVTHPMRGEFSMPGFVVKMSGSHVRSRVAAARADNEAVYGGLLGLTAES